MRCKWCNTGSISSSRRAVIDKVLIIFHTYTSSEILEIFFFFAEIPHLRNKQIMRQNPCDAWRLMIDDKIEQKMSKICRDESLMMRILWFPWRSLSSVTSSQDHDYEYSKSLQTYTGYRLIMIASISWLVIHTHKVYSVTHRVICFVAPEVRSE